MRMIIISTKGNFIQVQNEHITARGDKKNNWESYYGVLGSRWTRLLYILGIFIDCLCMRGSNQCVDDDNSYLWENMEKSDS